MNHDGDNGASPATDGFVMPGEWGEHSACWMAWPCRAEVWGGASGMMRARRAFAEVARAIGEFERVMMVVNPPDENGARKLVGAGAEIVPLPLDDSWMRDSGATFVRDKFGAVAGVNWRFNAWGEKYSPYQKDDAVARGVLDILEMRCYDAPLVMEGGSFHCDGDGAVMTTEQCLLHTNRNPTLKREDIEKSLRAYLGCETVIWLAGDERDDETDGHIDNVACFCAPGEVLAMNGDGMLGENIKRLREVADNKGRKLEVRVVPKPNVRENGEDMLASYINFYPANGGVVMPRFGVKEDDEARGIVAESFPGRRVVQVNARDIVRGGGGIHCITQQQPAGDTAPPKPEQRQ